MDQHPESGAMGVHDSATRGEMLGTCAACESSIPQTNLVVKYRTENGWPRILAECPDCEAVVHPT